MNDAVKILLNARMANDSSRPTYKHITKTR